MAKISVIQSTNGVCISDCSAFYANYNNNMADNKMEERKLKVEEILSMPQFNSFHKQRGRQENTTSKNCAQNFIEKYKAELLSLENLHAKWTALHPELWSPNEVIDWLYYFADSSGIDCSRFRAEAFQDKTGRELCLMNPEHFNELDPLYGKQIYDNFHRTVLSSSEIHLLNNESFINPTQNFYTELLNAENFSTSSSSSSSSNDSVTTTITTTSIPTISLPGRTNPTNSTKLIDNWTSHVCHNNYFDIKVEEQTHERGDEYHEGATAFQVLQNNNNNNPKYIIPPSINDQNPKFWCTTPLPPPLPPPPPPPTHNHHHHHHHHRLPLPPPPSPSPMTVPPSPNVYSDSPPLHHPHPLPPPPPPPSSSSVPHEMAERLRTQFDNNNNNNNIINNIINNNNNNRDEDIRQNCKNVAAAVVVRPERRQTKVKRLGQGSKGTHLWEFIRDLLHDGKFCPRLIKWEDPNMGVFRFVQSEAVAQMWGQKKNNTSMTYEKLSRAMRFCRSAGYFAPLPKASGFPKKLCFKFGPKAFGWKDNSSLK